MDFEIPTTQSEVLEKILYSLAMASNHNVLNNEIGGNCHLKNGSEDDLC